MEGQKEIICNYGADTEEWIESQIKYGQLKEEMVRKIGLSIGFEGLIRSCKNGRQIKGGMLEERA